jgi:hypothetical protein
VLHGNLTTQSRSFVSPSTRVAMPIKIIDVRKRQLLKNVENKVIVNSYIATALTLLGTNYGRQHYRGNDR